MPDILHRVGIRSKPDQVFEAINTIQGLSHWWTTETSGNTGLGKIVDFGFTKMKVTKFVKNKLLEWRCMEGPEEWIDTSVTFKLVYKEKQTFVLFSHAGWKSPVEFMYHCSTKWATFLLSLRNWVERGEGHPAPYDVKIHVND
ncbi:SRPBCC domain-containing protein [Leptospira fletcheri]|uniref:SRPBCC domain-containing protein n=1 Tax=Leptospira fletcheri TaxID=2484981 RepID=A0A4R9GB92_9LEPT|nr:SRPBCC domain-containing protein [Leptospira fletcheri]TGK08964.1 SRPBCC domain-containing protein [Leptospira fletcheri]